MLSILVSKASGLRIEEFCQLRSKPLRNRQDDLDYEMPNVIDPKKDLIHSSKSSDINENLLLYKGEKYKPTIYIAMKIEVATSETAKEIELMKAMSDAQVAPTFYGCQYTKTEPIPKSKYESKTSTDKAEITVYIAQKLLKSNLEEYEVRKELQSINILERKITLWAQVVSGLYKLNLLGYAHSELDLTNLLVDESLSKIFIIDYKKAQLLEWPEASLKPSEKSLLMQQRNLRIRNDLASLALIIAVIEGNFKNVKDFQFNMIFKNSPNPKPQSGVKGQGSNSSKDNIASILEKCGIFFENSKFGRYQRTEENPFKWNFTTLLMRIMDPSLPFDYSSRDVFKIMDNIIGNIKAIKKIKTPPSKIFLSNLSNADMDNFEDLFKHSLDTSADKTKLLTEDEVKGVSLVLQSMITSEQKLQDLYEKKETVDESSGIYERNQYLPNGSSLLTRKEDPNARINAGTHVGGSITNYNTYPQISQLGNGPTYQTKSNPTRQDQFMNGIQSSNIIFDPPEFGFGLNSKPLSPLQTGGQHIGKMNKSFDLNDITLNESVYVNPRDFERYRDANDSLDLSQPIPQNKVNEFFKNYRI